VVSTKGLARIIAYQLLESFTPSAINPMMTFHPLTI
jgi:hypothetical protein